MSLTRRTSNDAHMYPSPIRSNKRSHKNARLTHNRSPLPHTQFPRPVPQPPTPQMSSSIPQQMLSRTSISEHPRRTAFPVGVYTCWTLLDALTYILTHRHPIHSVLWSLFIVSFFSVFRCCRLSLRLVWERSGEGGEWRIDLLVAHLIFNPAHSPPFDRSSFPFLLFCVHVLELVPK